MLGREKGAVMGPSGHKGLHLTAQCQLSSDIFKKPHKCEGVVEIERLLKNKPPVIMVNVSINLFYRLTSGEWFS